MQPLSQLQVENQAPELSQLTTTGHEGLGIFPGLSGFYINIIMKFSNYTYFACTIMSETSFYKLMEFDERHSFREPDFLHVKPEGWFEGS